MALLSPRVARLQIQFCYRVAASAAWCQTKPVGSMAAGSPSSSQLQAIHRGKRQAAGPGEEKEEEVVLRLESSTTSPSPDAGMVHDCDEGIHRSAS
jgi:hypothetical protein